MISVMLRLIVCLSVIYRLNWSLRDARMELRDQGFEDLKKKGPEVELQRSAGAKKNEEKEQEATAKAVGMYRFSGTCTLLHPLFSPCISSKP